MPRITGLTVEQSGGAGFSGRGRVIDCYAVVDAPQAPKEGQPAPTYERGNTLNWVFEVQPTDDNGQPLLEQPKTIRASLGKKWNAPTATTAFHYAVGHSVDRNDPEPRFVGIEPGARGNTVYVPTAGMGRPKGTSFDKLFASLANHVPQAAIDAMQAEEFIGMLADFVRKEEVMMSGGVPQLDEQGQPRKWGWTEVSAVISMPNCPDFPGNKGAAQVVHNPGHAQAGAQPVRPAGGPPVRPVAPVAQAPVAPAPVQHAPVQHAPVAPAPTPAGNNSAVAAYNILNNCAGMPGVFVQGTAYTPETLLATVVPKIMTIPAVGGANPAQRQVAAQQFRQFVTTQWETFCAEVATHTGQKFMTDGAGSIYFM